LRIQFSGAGCHATSRGDERRAIFCDDADRGRILDILSDRAATDGVEIDTGVLMTNHFYWVAPTSLANLNRFMARFNSTEASAGHLTPLLAVTSANMLPPRSRHRDERAIFVELCRRPQPWTPVNNQQF
jgi:hypothetical protein